MAKSHVTNTKTNNNFNTAVFDRDRAEGGAGGALAPPLFCKNKNKFNKSNGVKNSKKSLIRK